jgi:hypothetical protein
MHKYTRHITTEEISDHFLGSAMQNEIISVVALMILTRVTLDEVKIG